MFPKVVLRHIFLLPYPLFIVLFKLEHDKVVEDVLTF